MFFFGGGDKWEGVLGTYWENVENKMWNFEELLGKCWLSSGNTVNMMDIVDMANPLKLKPGRVKFSMGCLSPNFFYRISVIFNTIYLHTFSLILTI